MLNMIKNVPLALSGLLLSIVALANLLTPFSPTVRPILQGIAVVGILLVLVKCISDRRAVQVEFHQPIVASCFATLLMAIQLLSSSLPLPTSLGYGLWYLTFIAYSSYIVFFTNRFVRQRNLTLVYPSWFIVYVGFAMVGVSAPRFGEYVIGWFSLVFASLAFLILFPIILYRLYQFRIEKGRTPILAIFAAPVSLILTAYLSLAQESNDFLVLSLLVVSQTIYVIVVMNFYFLAQGGFTPLYSSFTFPLVSTAIGFNLALARLEVNSPILFTLSYLEIVIAVAIVAYVLYSYIALFFKESIRPSVKEG